MIRRGVIEKGKLRTVYKSQTFPTTGYGHAHNLHPVVVAKVKQAFYTYKWSETFKKEFKKADRFINIRHKTHWDVIRKIDAANGVSYNCK
jgi:phosphonate transport system substrate-binding protein